MGDPAFSRPVSLWGTVADAVASPGKDLLCQHPMAAPVVLADREPVLPVPPGASAIQVEGATSRAPVVAVPATIDAGVVRAGANPLGPVGAGASPAGTNVSRRRAVAV